MNWKNISRTLSLAAAGIGALGFAGWVFDIDALKRLHPAWVTMKANTALCLLLAGTAVALRRDENEGVVARCAAHGCAIVITTIGLLTFGECLGWWDAHIDQMFFAESVAEAGRSFPGRMGPASALNFILLGLAVLLLGGRAVRPAWPAQVCALAVIGSTFFVFLTYFYAVELPPDLAPYLSIALHTVIAFLLLAIAILLARPDRGIMAVVLAEDTAGIVARRLLPAALLGPALIGWLCTLGRNAGYYGRGVGTALLATAVTLIFTNLVWWAARELAASDAQRRTAESARNRLAAIVDSSADAIVSKTLDGIVTSWNAGAERLFGYSSDEMIGQPILRVIPAERQGEEAEILGRLRAGESIEHYETVQVTKDGRALDVSLTISPVRDDSSAIIGASIIVREISARKQAEAAVAKARDEAEAANRAKDDFIAVLSHELRTPLTPALVTVAELETAPPSDPAAMRESLALIRRNIELEARLVDDLLDLTRIRRGKLRIASAPLDLHVTLRDALAIAEPMLREKNIVADTSLDAHRHLVRGDSARLAQVFSNLLTNAAKFTPDTGCVTIHTANSDGKLRVEITDTGIGIAPEVLPRIFEAFSQGEASITRLFGGLGLGLSVARSLVEAHGGTIEARSAGHDRGATFTVTFPALDATRIESDAAAPTAPTPAPRSLRVLLVEDHEDTRNVLLRLLKRWGHTVTTAGDVAQARAAIAAGTFDLLLSDIGLPDGSGLDVVTALRERSDIPAVAMSGYGMEADIERARTAGFTEHIVKPVTAEGLRELLTRM